MQLLTWQAPRYWTDCGGEPTLGSGRRDGHGDKAGNGASTGECHPIRFTKRKLMDLPEAYSSLHQRLYCWSMADFHREIKQGFPLLNTITNTRAKYLLQLMASLKEEERYALADALVRKSYQSALSGMGIILTLEDKELLQTYNSYDPGHISGYNLVLTPPQTTKRNITKSKMFGLINEALEPMLGHNVSQVGKNEIYFTTQINKWVMKTFIGMHSNGIPQLYYDHVLDRSDRSLQYESPILMISIMSWLGIGRTEWTLSSASSSILISSLTNVVSHFTEAVPILVEGLE